MPEIEQIDVLAINVGERKVCIDEGTVVDIVSFHNSDDDDCHPDDASFVTFQLPNGKWAFAMLSDFGGALQ